MTENTLKLGVFGFNGGAAFTKHPDRFKPTWENNVRIAQHADRIGIEKLVSASRWKAFGGDGHYSGDLFETFTWAAALAAVTERAEILSTVHLPVVNPVIAAKAAATIDLISGGRFGMNLVCGWYRAEMEMFGSPMVGHADRYALANEWVEIFDRLWSDTESFDYDGEFYHLKGAIVQPRSPFKRPTLLNAGGSERGRDFAAKHCDVAFIVPQDPRPEAIKQQVDEYRQLAWEKYNKKIEVWMSSYVVQRESMETARAYVDDYVITQGDPEGVDAFMTNNVGNAETWPKEILEHVRYGIAAGYGGYPLLGTEQDIAGRMAELSNAGIDGFLMTWLDYEVFEMATSNGARAGGWGDRIGSIEVGKAADIAIFDVSGPEWWPAPFGNPVPDLVYSGSGRDVRTVIVNGVVVKGQVAVVCGQGSAALRS